MANQYHRDLGGDTACMQVINKEIDETGGTLFYGIDIEYGRK